MLDKEAAKAKLWKELYEEQKAIPTTNESESESGQSKKANPIRKAIIKKLQLSLLDKIIEEFMQNHQERLKRGSPSDTMMFGNKLIDDLN